MAGHRSLFVSRQGTDALVAEGDAEVSGGVDPGMVKWHYPGRAGDFIQGHRYCLFAPGSHHDTVDSLRDEVGAS